MFDVQSASDSEKRAITYLAERFAIVRSLRIAELMAAAGVEDPKQQRALIMRLVHFGFISGLSDNSCVIEATAASAAALIELHEAELALPKDQFAATQSWFRSNPILARLLVGFVAALAILQLANSLIDLLAKLGVFKLPKP
jgi:hypothetical protein